MPYKKDPDGGSDRNNWEYRDVPIYWPHEVLKFIFDEVGVAVPLTELRKYWENAREHGLPWAKDSADDAQPRIPIKFFGDDATYNQQGDKFLGFIISCPLWRPNSGRNSRWPVAVISLYNSLGYPTMHPILRNLVWSLNVAFDVPLPRTGHVFQVTELGGDWKYHRESFTMRTHWNSAKMCHCCSIDRAQYALFEEPLPWRNTTDFISSVVDEKWPSPLILLRRFSVFCIEWCLLHNVHLGLLWTCNGAALDYLLNLGAFGSPQTSLQARLFSAYLHFKAWQKRNRIRASQRRFTYRMLYKKAHGAYLSAKGWNSRVLCAWLAEVSEHAWNSMESPDEELVLLTYAMPAV